MNNTLDGTDKESDFIDVYETYVNDVYRLCFSFLKNHMDAEDAVQETFLKYYHCGKTFETKEHKKAWLIVTASNRCKDMLKHWWHRRQNLDDYAEQMGGNDSETDEMMSLIMELPAKYKTAIYLYYYEGYTSVEIAGLLNRPASTIRTYLKKAREMLKRQLAETEVRL